MSFSSSDTTPLMNLKIVNSGDNQEIELGHFEGTSMIYSIYTITLSTGNWYYIEPYLTPISCGLYINNNLVISISGIDTESYKGTVNFIANGASTNGVTPFSVSFDNVYIGNSFYNYNVPTPTPTSTPILSNQFAYQGTLTSIDGYDSNSLNNTFDVGSNVYIQQDLSVSGLGSLDDNIGTGVFAQNSITSDAVGFSVFSNGIDLLASENGGSANYEYFYPLSTIGTENITVEFNGTRAGNLDIDSGLGNVTLWINENQVYTNILSAPWFNSLSDYMIINSADSGSVYSIISDSPFSSLPMPTSTPTQTATLQPTDTSIPTGTSIIIHIAPNTQNIQNINNPIINVIIDFSNSTILLTIVFIILFIAVSLVILKSTHTRRV